MPNRVVFAQDPLRGPRLGMVEPVNLRWLAGLLGPIFRRAGWAVATIGQEGWDRKFDVGAFLDACERAPTQASWARLFGDTRLPEAARRVLDNAFAGDVIIGFGLPPFIVAWCLDRQVPFLDVEIHPIRFCPDLLVSVTSSIPVVADMLVGVGPDESSLCDAASVLAARYQRNREGLELPRGVRAGLFAGQAPVDAALIAGGRIVAPSDALAAVRARAERFDLLLVRPHPHWPGVEHLRPLHASIRNAIMCRSSSYALLGNPAVTDVIGLSSSLLSEAPFFAKGVHRLIKPDREIVMDLPLPLCHAGVPLPRLLVACRHVAEGTPRVTRAAAANVVQPMTLRESLGENWGLAATAAPEPVSLAPMEEVVFDTARNCTGCLVSGWHPVESWGVWSAEPTAHVLLLLDPPATRSHLVIRLRAMLSPQSAVQVATIRTRAGREVTARFSLAKPGTQALGLDLQSDDVLAGRFAEFTVHVSNIESPADARINEDRRRIGIGLVSIMRLDGARRMAEERLSMTEALADADYYQQLHDTHQAYQSNNWLVEEADLVAGIPGRCLLEVGCGNGRFLEIAAASRERVIGCDWAMAPGLQEIITRHPNVSFVRCDIRGEMPHIGADVVVSADVLEHFAVDDVPGIIARLHTAGAWNFHKIACYDDEHSHLTVKPPGWWLAHFCAADPGYRLIRYECRLGDVSRPVCIVSNYPFVERGLASDPLDDLPEVASLRKALATAGAHAQVLDQAIAEREATIAALKLECSQLRSALDLVRQSKSVRYTQPLRTLASVLRGVIRRR